MSWVSGTDGPGVGGRPVVSGVAPSVTAMPSSAHEVLVEAFRQRPELAAQLLSGALGVRLPGFDTATVEPAEVVDLAPTEHRADTVVALSEQGAPVRLVIVEIQLSPDEDKQWTWPQYLHNLRTRRRCPTTLLVVCVDPATAAWAATPIETGHPGHVLVPLVLGPDRIPCDAATLAGEPELAVVAAVAHGRAHHDVLDVLATALGAVETEQALMYVRLVLSALPDAARRHLEELMTSGTVDYQSEFTERLRDEGRDEGRAEGEVRARTADILRILRVRGITVPDAAREQITACVDLDRLDTWIDRAVTADGVEDLGL